MIHRLIEGLYVASLASAQKLVVLGILAVPPGIILEWRTEKIDRDSFPTDRDPTLVVCNHRTGRIAIVVRDTHAKTIFALRISDLVLVRDRPMLTSG